MLLCAVDNVCCGSLCYDCRDIPHPRDCSKLTQCSSNEICAVDKYLTSDARIFFNSGCLDPNSCHIIIPDPAPIVGRRSFGEKRVNGDRQVCSACCHGNFCNDKLCDYTFPTGPPIQVKRCMSCSMVERPEDCHTITGCDPSEECIHSRVIGKRSRHDPTLYCCNDEMCNQHSYNATLSTNTANSHTGYFGACADTTAMQCHNPDVKAIACNEPLLKYLCRHSCDICDLPPPILPSCHDGLPDRCNDTAFRYQICHDVPTATIFCAKSCGICH